LNHVLFRLVRCYIAITHYLCLRFGFVCCYPVRCCCYVIDLVTQFTALRLLLRYFLRSLRLPPLVCSFVRSLVVVVRYVYTFCLRYVALIRSCCSVVRLRLRTRYVPVTLRFWFYVTLFVRCSRCWLLLYSLFWIYGCLVTVTVPHVRSLVRSTFDSYRSLHCSFVLRFVCCYVVLRFLLRYLVRLFANVYVHVITRDAVSDGLRLCGTVYRSRCRSFVACVLAFTFVYRCLLHCLRLHLPPRTFVIFGLRSLVRRTAVYLRCSLRSFYVCSLFGSGRLAFVRSPVLLVRFCRYRTISVVRLLVTLLFRLLRPRYVGYVWLRWFMRSGLTGLDCYSSWLVGSGSFVRSTFLLLVGYTVSVLCSYVHFGSLFGWFYVRFVPVRLHGWVTAFVYVLPGYGYYLRLRSCRSLPRFPARSPLLPCLV